MDYFSEIIKYVREIIISSHVKAVIFWPRVSMSERIMYDVHFCWYVFDIVRKGKYLTHT